MGSRSKYTRRRGEALVPRAVLDVLHVAVGAKAPTSADDVGTAREASRRLQSLCRQHHVSARRLRENHGWNDKQSYEPWAVVTPGGRVVIVPKSTRFKDGATLKALAVVPEQVFPHDEDDRADDKAEWMPLGNSGKGKPTWSLPAWGRLAIEPAGANWLKEGLAAAVQGTDKREALIRSSPDTNIVLAYAYDLCAFWANPDTKPPALTCAFDAEGALKPVDDGAAPQTLSEQAAEDREAWQDALATDAEQDAVAASQHDDGGKPLKRGGEA